MTPVPARPPRAPHCRSNVELRRRDQRDARFLMLEVPGLAEQRPSVMKGDALYVTRCDGADGGVESQGFVHAVELLDVSPWSSGALSVRRGKTRPVLRAGCSAAEVEVACCGLRWCLRTRRCSCASALSSTSAGCRACASTSGSPSRAPPLSSCRRVGGAATPHRHSCRAGGALPQRMFARSST